MNRPALTSALMAGALALATPATASGSSDRGSVCDPILALSTRILGCRVSTEPDQGSWLEIRVDRAGLAADYAAAYAAANAAPDPAGELQHRAMLIQTTAERGAVHALVHDTARSLSEVRIEDGRGPRVIRRETIEACRVARADDPSPADPEASETILVCLASVQPSVFTLVDKK
jgi:hypothetical protein